MEDQILKGLGDVCITAIVICCKKDSCSRRQTFVRYVGRTSPLWEYVFEMGELDI